MRTFMKIFSIILISAWIWSCSGSKATSGGMSEAKFEDVQLQAQAEALQKQIEEKPNNMEYRRQLAELYHNNGYDTQSMKVLEEALRIDPNDTETKYQYAETALSAGDKLRAYNAYKAVLQSADGENYLDRIAPKFSDAFKVEKIIGSEAQEAFANFSADGQKIIYQSDQTGNWDIFEYDLTTQTTRQLTDFPSQEENPSFSPDGSNIIYTSTKEDHRDVDFNQKRRDIYVMDLQTGRETNLTTNGSDDWRPRYSPDGQYIVFVSQRNDLRDVPFYQLFGNIFIMENDGRFQLMLTDTQSNNGDPCVLPGSTEEKGTIFFDSDRNGKYAIYSMDFKGANVRQITFNPDANDVSPAASSNGDKIVFFSDRDGNYEIYLMNNDGSAQQRLTSNPADDLNPVFSPDGQKVLFHSNRDGNYDIFLLDLSAQAGTLPIYDVIKNIDTAINYLN